MMEGNISGIGLMRKWKDKGFSAGQMGEFIKVLIPKIKNMGMESSVGMIKGNSRGPG